METNLLLLVLAVPLGLALGSFCGCVGFRIANGWSLFSPSFSHCPRCKKRLAWFENIPLLSFLLQRGRCRACGNKLSVLYPVAEASAMCWSVFLIFKFGLSPLYGAYLLIGMILLLISLVDLQAYFIPDELVLLGAVLAGGAAFLRIGVPVADAFVAGIAGALLMQAIRLGYRWLRRAEGMGLGDVKLMFLLGLGTGTAGLSTILIVSAVLAAIFTIARDGASVSAAAKLPFGPFLCLGAAIHILAQDNSFYLSG